jgi:colicin import membrane protein
MRKNQADRVRFDMTNKKAKRYSEDSLEMRWSPMVILSVAFHLAVFLSILFIPESLPARRSFDGVVYEVNLVEMPGGGTPSGAKGVPAQPAQKAEPIVKKETPAKRIPEVPKPEEKPVVIAKKTLDKPAPPAEKPKVAPSDLIDKAISKIEGKVKTEEHLDKALARLESKAEESKGDSGPAAGGGLLGGGQPGGTAMQIYQAEVESLIKSNWHYPVAMDNQKDLEAIVVLMVKSDGTVMRSRFDKRSQNVLFDESVLKAIERSNPLPPFPESYRKSHEEFEINFNLKDFETN